jgi:hypothetical protein
VTRKPKQSGSHGFVAGTISTEIVTSVYPEELSHVFLLRIKKISEQPCSNGEP